MPDARTPLNRGDYLRLQSLVADSQLSRERPWSDPDETGRVYYAAHQPTGIKVETIRMASDTDKGVRTRLALQLLDEVMDYRANQAMLAAVPVPVWEQCDEFPDWAYFYDDTYKDDPDRGGPRLMRYRIVM